MAFSLFKKKNTDFNKKSSFPANFPDSNFGPDFSSGSKEANLPSGQQMPPAYSPIFSEQEMKQQIPEPPKDTFFPQSAPPGMPEMPPEQPKGFSESGAFAGTKFSEQKSQSFSQMQDNSMLFRQQPVQFPDFSQFKPEGQEKQQLSNQENQAMRAMQSDFAPGLAASIPRQEIDTGKPIFIKVDKYKIILKELSNIKSLIRNAALSIDSLNSIKDAEDSELEEWRSKLEDIERKLIYIDDSLFGTL
jgi:hypothetical protein